MQKLLTISKDSSIKVSSMITNFLSPSELYLPIYSNAQVLIKHKEIKKSEPLYIIENKTYYSPVSGKVKNIVYRKDINHKNQTYLHIINDYREEDTFVGLDTFTTINLSIDFTNKIKKNSNINWHQLVGKKRLIFNGIEDEPYSATKTFIHLKYPNEILQTLDVLASSFQIPKIIIYLKETDSESINAFEDYLSTYPNIELSILPDIYPISSVLKEYLNLTDEDYLIKTETVWDLYNEIIRERVKDSMLLTITGDAIENPQVVNAKIGTPVQELIDSVIMIKDKNNTCYINGIMSGIVANPEDLVLTEDIHAIYLMKNKKDQAKECIECGKCNEICPHNCHPYEAKFFHKKKNLDQCLSCGLCSFICPSHISLGLKERPCLLHYENKSKKEIYALWVFILLALYGSYKNGFIYLFQGKMNFINAMIPLAYPTFGLFVSVVTRLLKNEKCVTHDLIEGIILGILMPPRFPLGIYLIMVIIYFILKRYLFHSKSFTISSILLFKVVSILISLGMHLDYQNIIELNNAYKYGAIDTLLGRSIGNIGTTNIILLLVLYFVSCTDYYYKKELPIIIYTSYAILDIIYMVVMKQSGLIISLMPSSLLFMSIVCSRESMCSPINKKQLWLYGIVIGIFGFIFYDILSFRQGIYFILLLMEILLTFVRKRAKKA